MPDLSPHSAPIGHIVSVRGSRAQVGLPALSPLSKVRPTVGSFLAMQGGEVLLIGVVSNVEATVVSGSSYQAWPASTLWASFP